MAKMMPRMAPKMRMTDRQMSRVHTHVGYLKEKNHILEEVHRVLQLSH
jgi:hypothetical protein